MEKEPEKTNEIESNPKVAIEDAQMRTFFNTVHIRAMLETSINAQAQILSILKDVDVAKVRKELNAEILKRSEEIQREDLQRLVRARES